LIRRMSQGLKCGVHKEICNKIKITGGCWYGKISEISRW
jgi:hypothetical protein